MKNAIKTLEAAQSALKEAATLKDANLRQKKTLEAQKALDTVLVAMKEAALKPSGEAEQGSTINADMEAGVQHDADNQDCECESCMPSDGDDAAEPASHKVTHTTVSKGKAAIAAAAKQESERKELLKIAVEKLIEESGIDKKFFDIPGLCAMSFAEAKADIGKQKRMHESAVATVLSKVGRTVSASHRTRESAVADEGGNEDVAENNSEFALLSEAK